MTTPSEGISDEEWTGFVERECTEHRTTGKRAWCFDCSEWCYPNIPCKGCELPSLRARIDAAEATIAELTRERDENLSMFEEQYDMVTEYRDKMIAANQRIAELEGALREIADGGPESRRQQYIALAALSTHTEENP